MTDLSDRIVALGKVDFATVEAAIERQGLVRDPDRGSVRPDAAGMPSFASWSGAEGDGREVDFHRNDDLAWLALRGEGADELAETLASEIGARHAGTVENGLATIMTRPRWSRASSRDNARGWHMLQAAITSYNEANSTLVRALIHASLSDPDWRMRMTAMLAIGRLHLADLAQLAMKTEVPQAGKAGVSQKDRRLLLALRQAAHDVGLGLPPSSGPGDGKDEAVAALRRSFQAELHHLLSGDPRGGHSVAAALVTKLLGGQY
jgi:hypothetical protein